VQFAAPARLTVHAPRSPPVPEAKTKPTAVNVDDYLASKATAEQLADCKALMALLKRVTKQPATMWGPSIVGYGRYTYRLANGRSGESCLTGFAIRGKDLVLYLVAEGADQTRLLATVGKHRMGKACLYFRRLADLDLKVLEQLVAASVAEIKRRHAADTGT
jgi:Domain of unknown function (DU1801)